MIFIMALTYMVCYLVVFLGLFLVILFFINYVTFSHLKFFIYFFLLITIFSFVLRGA